MNLRQSLLKIEKKYAWSFIGFILAVIFGGITIYTTFFQEKNPRLEYRIESSTKVIDVKEEIEQLQIFYKDDDIIKSKRNLSVLRIRIINNSSVNILKNSYDNEIPFGFYLENAEILKPPEILNASNDYLRKRFEIKRIGNDSIQFPQLIIDGGDYILLDILTIHDKETIPIVHPIGKISGMKEIKLIASYKTVEDSIWSKTISGKLIIQILRFIIYAVLVPVGLIIILVIILILIYLIVNWRRKKILRGYRLKKEVHSSKENNLIFYYYIEEGKKYLNRIERIFNTIVTNPARLNIVYYKGELIPTKNYDEDDFELVSELFSRNIIIYDTKKNQLKINKVFWNRLKDLNSYLKLI